jgi:hypothetical protein
LPRSSLDEMTPGIVSQNKSERESSRSLTLFPDRRCRGTCQIHRFAGRNELPEKFCLLRKRTAGEPFAGSLSPSAAPFSRPSPVLRFCLPLSFTSSMMRVFEDLLALATIVGWRLRWQMKHKLMNRSVDLCGTGEKERRSRLVSNVFNFEVGPLTTDSVFQHFCSSKFNTLKIRWGRTIA